MTTREQLHAWIDKLPETELARVARRFGVDKLDDLSQEKKQATHDLKDFKTFLQSMPEGLDTVERDNTPTRTVSL